MASASEPNISINQKLILKKKLIKLTPMKYVTVKISIWTICKYYFIGFYIFGGYFLFLYIIKFFEKFLYSK